MKVLYLGNCQVSIIKDFCNYYLNVKGDYLNIIEDLKFENKKASSISQHFYSGIFYYNDDKILELLPEKAKIVYVHVLYFDGYFIDNEKKFKNLETPINATDLAILKTPYMFHLINEKFSNEEILEKLDDKFSKKEIIGGAQLSLEKLYERENGLGNKNSIDVKICDYIKENYKNIKLFHTLNHPSNLLLNYYSVKICNYINNLINIDIKPYNKDFDKGHERLGSTTIPIYKKVVDILNLSFDTQIYHKYKKHSINTYIDFIRNETY